MDVATDNLKAITQGEDYVRLDGIPVFDAHDEFDADGNLIRRFDKAKLQDICDRTNRRAEETGDLAPIGPGHTALGVAETEQPPIYGFAADYRVGEFGPKKKTGILANFYVKRTIETEDGRTLDGLKAVKSYPRRSVELWLRDGYLDRVALLRKTPQRDLGLLTFSKEQPVTLFGSPRGRGLAAVVRAGKLCYAMDNLEANMDPVLPGDANAPDNDLESKIDAYLNSKYPHLAKIYDELSAKYEPSAEEPIGGDAPPMGGDMPPPPAPGGDLPPPTDEKLDFAKNPKSAANRVIYLEKTVRDLTARLAAADKARADEKLAYSKADAVKRVDLLEQDGIPLDRNIEIARFEKISLEARDDEEAYIRKTRRPGLSRSLPPSGFVPTGGKDSPKAYSKDAVEKARDYCLANPGTSYDDALAKFAK